jgi:hypothetical protein
MGMINAPGAQAFAMPGTYAVPVNITKSKFGVLTIQFPSTQAMFGLTPQEIVNQIKNRQNAYSQGISPAYQEAVSRMAHTYGLDYTSSVWGGDDDRAKTALAMDVMSNPGFYSYDTREKAYEQAFGGIGSELAGMGYNQQEEDAFDAGYEAAMGSSGGFGGGSEGVDGGFSGGFSGGIEEAAVEGGDTGLGQASSSSSTGGGSDGGSDSDSDDGCFITTATCLTLGKNDDCYELNLFRWLRDNYIIKQPQGKQLVRQYYKIAPQIVAKINRLGNKARDIYALIWKHYLSSCLKMIEAKQYKQATDLYMKMVKTLRKRFLKEG